jgi:glycosyltransferase involved in cell wall biosynthesis
MGRYGEETLLALDRMGVKVNVVPVILELEGLKPRTLELVQTEYDPSPATLFASIPEHVVAHKTERNYLFAAWDTTKAPDEWVRIINAHIDKVYPMSGFVYDVLAQSGVTVPMKVILLGVDGQDFPYLVRDWSSTFTFLAAGDLSHRKGTDALLRAFVKTFPSADVRLILKSNHSAEWGKLEVPDDGRVEVLDQRLSRQQFLALMRLADCFVFPSRAEGFGLPALEAMATGLPTILNTAGGLSSFTDVRYNYPLESPGFVPAPAYHYPDSYSEGGGIGEWFEVDVDALGLAMRHVFEHQDEARETGRKAAQWTRDTWDWDTSIEMLWQDIQTQEVAHSIREAPRRFQPSVPIWKMLMLNRVDGTVPVAPLGLFMTHHHVAGGGESYSYQLLQALSSQGSVDVIADAFQVSPAMFGLSPQNPGTSHAAVYQTYINNSFFELSKPLGYRNIAVVFYPMYDWQDRIKDYEVVTISEFSRAEIMRKWGVNSKVIYPCVDLGRFHAAPNKKRQIVSVGRFFSVAGGNNKLQDVMIQTLRQYFPGWRLVLVGSVQDEGYYRRCLDLAAGLDVDFRHDLSFDELVELYAESEVYWHFAGYGAADPSSYEHFGISALEAVASGCRTVVYGAGGIVEIPGVRTWTSMTDLVHAMNLGLPDSVDLTRFYQENFVQQWKELVNAD